MGPKVERKEEQIQSRVARRSFRATLLIGPCLVISVAFVEPKEEITPAPGGRGPRVESGEQHDSKNQGQIKWNMNRILYTSSCASELVLSGPQRPKAGRAWTERLSVFHRASMDASAQKRTCRCNLHPGIELVATRLMTISLHEKGLKRSPTRKKAAKLSS